MKRIYPFFFCKSWMLLSLCCLLSAGLSAQTRTIKGTVASSEGEPLIGATILVENETSRGTITDFNGNFSIEAATGEVLRVSYTGYEEKKITVGVENTLAIVLEASAEILDEVIVVGYGTQKKSDLTGAVASVSGEELRSSITTNIDQALQGRVAGVQVTQNSGQPGGAASIRIRGSNSITGSSEPLYVIDGIPFQGDGTAVAGFDWAGGANGQNRVNPLSTINPNDIVSIEVLKDASATAIYGARAANGVVLISTRRGEEGTAKISYNGYYASQSLARKLEMMPLPDYASYQVQIANDLNLPVNQRYLDPSLLGNGTDWQDEIFRTAGMQSHQLSVSGGSKNTQYAISGGFLGQDGIVIGSNFERFTTRVNLDNQVNKWFKIGASLAYANTDEVITLNDGGDGVIMQSLAMPPDVPVRDFNGEFAGPSTNLSYVSFNPVGAALLRNNTLNRQRLMANLYGDLQLMKNLSFRSEIGFDDNHSINKSFHPTYSWGALQNNENQLRQREENSFFWIWKNYLTYTLKFGERHNLSALLGTEAQQSNWAGSQVTKKQFASNDIQVLSEGNDETSSTSGWEDGASLASYFGRFNYGFDERYLFTFTMRADGSSKFGPNNKWGYFPSGSFAWRVSNEAFMENQELIYDMKLRLGYGEVGNQAIANYLYGASLLTVNTPFGTGYRLEKISNPDLKWEATKQFNAGLDLSLFQGRVDFTIDVYQKQTTDMLLQLSIPSYLGGTNWNDIRAPFANIGRMENKGFDLALTTRNVSGKKFSWTTNLTFSRNRNKVLELDDDSRVYWRNLYWYSEFQTATQTSVGLPVGVFYGYVVEGLFIDQEDILNHAVQVTDNNITDENPYGKNLVSKTQGVWVGDIKFKDLNGDGVVDVNDQTIIGDPNPDFTFGLNNNFNVGPFSLTVYLNGAYGADILNYSRVVIEGQTSVFNNQAATVADRAQIALIDPNGPDDDPENVYLANPDTDLPRPTTNDNNRNNRMSDRFIEDGSYIRIQNVRLGYTLPTAFTQKFRIQHLKLYVNAQNLYTITNYSGYDPEIGAFNQDPLLQNVDMGRYPSPRLITFGLDVDF
ncbi:MAG TPA: TonB-dependent receptor [Saprospiraceae bacterium]|nr:TonB-dependent receptor [Saprospiraceae bacterium]HMQ81409.1 TonB-dependent receptor [Saprospiraceae bacterium]